LILLWRCMLKVSTHWKWHTPKLLDGFNCGSKGEDIGRKRSWGAFVGSQHFEGRGVCWNSSMGTRKIDKQFNYSHGLATHTDLHKPNNKLVSA
jgi:hypothetical protein